MNKKNMIVTGLAAMLVLAMAAWSVAGPGYGRGYGACGGPGYGSAYSQLSPEKQAAADAIYEKYSAQYNELKTEMWTKHSTLQAMVNGGDADEKKIGKLTADITELRDKMYDLRKQMGDELTEATGITAGRGYGGCPGYGQSGCPGYGGGPGPKSGGEY